ncbi:hypothetical protein BpHYR1_002985 [Brachionus plicatilis]|uniref:Uncharacterized protein n=1 Tax=Brachionus plicatilis TaxID=10195 RepID=A0A3M7RU67_BRAPC|nr:hypothetical protein BpHYR1_002985 [Brachionus plicatilis]
MDSIGQIITKEIEKLNIRNERILLIQSEAPSVQAFHLIGLKIKQNRKSASKRTGANTKDDEYVQDLIMVVPKRGKRIFCGIIQLFFHIFLL